MISAFDSLRGSSRTLWPLLETTIPLSDTSTMELKLDKNLFSSSWTYFNFGVEKYRPDSCLFSFKSFLHLEPFQYIFDSNKGFQNYSAYEIFYK
jgi:hypothetical protein